MSEGFDQVRPPGQRPRLAVAGRHRGDAFLLFARRDRLDRLERPGAHQVAGRRLRGGLAGGTERQDLAHRRGGIGDRAIIAYIILVVFLGVVGSAGQDQYGLD